MTPGRLLAAGYALFVVAAGGRTAVQLATDAGRAPIAYSFSALAALFYLAGLLLLRHVERTARGTTAAAACCLVELGGVLGIGTASLLVPGWFGADTIWTAYGRGYAFVPLALPALALAWLAPRLARSSVLVSKPHRTTAL